MKIIYLGNDKIHFKSYDEEYTFIDLKQINGYELPENIKHKWVLSEYRKKMKNDSDFYLKCTYHQNGNVSEISFGYYTKNIIRRTIKLDKNKILTEDYIYLFNPKNKNPLERYNSVVPENTTIYDYVSDEVRFFESHDCKISNKLVMDSVVKDYIVNNEHYGNLLNKYSDDVNSIINIFDDENLDRHKKVIVIK